MKLIILAIIAICGLCLASELPADDFTPIEGTEFKVSLATESRDYQAVNEVTDDHSNGLRGNKKVANCRFGKADLNDLRMDSA